MLRRVPIFLNIVLVSDYYRTLLQRHQVSHHVGQLLLRQ